MKITKTQLKQIVQETLTEVRLDTQGTTAGTVQKIGSGAVGVATVAASILGTPIAGGVVATGGAWLNNMANKFWSNRKLSDVKLTEKMLVMAADKILSAANEKGLDEQEIVKAISDDIKERLKNVPVDTVKMLRFEEYEIDKTSGSAGAKAAVKDALKDQGLFGKDTAMHKVKRGVDVITSPAASIKKLGDPTKYLSESGKKITKSQLKQIIKEELSVVLGEDMAQPSAMPNTGRRAAELFACASGDKEVHKLFYDAAASALPEAERRNYMKVKEVSVTKDMVVSAFNANKKQGDSATYGRSGDNWLFSQLELMKTC